MPPKPLAGPLPLKGAIRSMISMAPTPNDSAYVPGTPEVPQAEPLLPILKTGKIPALRQFWTVAW